MAINLKTLALPESKFDERLIWVEFKGIKLQIRYISKATIIAIADSNRVAAYDIKSRGRSVTIDNEKFTRAIMSQIVKDWSGVTPRTLKNLYPLDTTTISPQELDEQIPFSEENLLEVISHAPQLDEFLQECSTEPGLFRSEVELSLEKNSSTSPSIT